jgi:aerobic carbon-monoxide dehydrogenase small subunit
MTATDAPATGTRAAGTAATTTPGGATVPVSMTVNGRRQRLHVEPRTLLVDLLRDVLGLTGAKVGCDTGQCGSCVLEIDGRSAKSCGVLAVQADGAAVRSIEADGADGELDALQEELWASHGTQCGFCTPGLVMSLRDLLARSPQPDEQEIRAWLDGTLCRCTGYLSIIRAVLAVAGRTG